MSLAVIGAGAIGLLMTAYLTKAGVQTMVVTHRSEQAKKLNESGLTIVFNDGSSEKVAVQAIPFASFDPNEAEACIITVKSYQLEAVMKLLHKRKAKWEELVFFQNGMGHLSIMSNAPSKIVSCGMVEHGARRDGDAKVRHTGLGTIRLGLVKGDCSSLQAEWASLEQIGFSLTPTSEWRKVMEAKLIANAAINPLTAMYQIRNGRLIENEHFKECLTMLVKEASLALGRKDIDDMLKNAKQICEQTASNSSSMREDVRNGRKTEIDSISGFILKEAEKRGLMLPYTRFVYKSICGLEGEGIT
ncbi:2-dehydropantoate 2-reductase [Halalkalibacterium ligniniphilum]|uniref:2-dehydropantoate 2-reductase n=1 Tax=Halalkalibacterium ligniniphilum TaxID=1134413 RepID=UPI0003488DC9|nr:2-dehydropantoate 2-reductase [Halalkalibacterium ligniniphilum]